MKVGIQVRCATCGLPKKPVGRSAPLEASGSLCDMDCSGYFEPPRVGDLWPRETEADFGYPIGPHGVREEE